MGRVVTETTPEGPDDQYRLLGLTVLSRYEVPGLGEVVKTLKSNSTKVKVVQLVTALSLLVSILTGMLPTLAVVLSGAAVLIAATVVGKKASSAAIVEARTILEKSLTGDDDAALKNAVTDETVLRDLVESGVASVYETHVVNVDSNELVLCSKSA